MTGMDDQTKKKSRITVLIFALLVIAIFLGYHLNQASPTTLGIVTLTLSVVAIAVFLVAAWRSNA
jgi:hypothetical protein